MDTFDSDMIMDLYRMRLQQAENERRARRAEAARRRETIDKRLGQPAWWLAWISTAFKMMSQ